MLFPRSEILSLKNGKKVKMTLNSSVPGRDSSEEKYGLFTNKKFGISWFALLFFLLVFLFNVSVIVPVILSLKVNKRMKNLKKLKSMDGPNDFRLILIQFHLNLIFLDFFLDMFITEITPVTSSSSEMMKPFPTSDEKYINVFFPVSDTKT